MIRIRKNRARLVASGKLRVEYRCANVRHYFHLYLWPGREEMLASGLPRERDFKLYDLEVYSFSDNTKACVPITASTWDMEEDGSETKRSRRKLGEMHFVVGDWDLEVVAHECGHVLAEVLRSVSPSAEDVVGQVGEAEEQMAYRLGAWVHNVYSWLWDQDPNPQWVREDG